MFFPQLGHSYRKITNESQRPSIRSVGRLGHSMCWEWGGICQDKSCCRAGKMVQLVKNILPKSEDLSLSPRIHISKKPGMVVHASNLSTKEVKTDGSLELSGQPA